MSNAQTLFSLEASAAYERDGFQDAVRTLRKTAGRQFLQADNLAVFRTSTSAKSDVVTNATVQPVLISVKSPATATTDSWLCLFNTSSSSVTLGGLPKAQEIFIVPYTKTRTYVVFPAADPCPYSGALSIAVTTSPHGGTAADATNAPVTTILYG
jgi:hypothetical protein